MRGIEGQENRQYLCEAYKEFFAYSEKRFLRLRNRLLAEKQTKSRNAPVSRKSVGRNDPCPCGSGKKYKKCHGNTHRVIAQTIFPFNHADLEPILITPE